MHTDAVVFIVIVIPPPPLYPLLVVDSFTCPDGNVLELQPFEVLMALADRFVVASKINNLAKF